MRGAARLALDSPDLRFRRPQRLAVQRPGQLRVELLGLFDQVAALLTVDGSSYAFFDAANGGLRRGVVHDDLLWQTARIALRPEEAVELLLGFPPRLEGALPTRALELEGGVVRVELRNSAGAGEQLDFDALGVLLRAERVDARGRREWTVRFGDRFAGPSAPGFPREIEIEFPQLEARVELSFSRVELPPLLPGELFVLHLPSGGS
jgi:hypothetical protein